MTVTLTTCAKTDVGLVRSQNEDAFVIADLTGGSPVEDQRLACFQVGERGALLAVSDGMGGHKAGEVASALVVQSLGRAIANQASDERPDILLEKATLEANREVWNAAHFPGREEMGATLTAVFVRDEAAYFAEVGDSRAYLLRGGQIVQLTRDQNYAQLLVESGAMSRDSAERLGMSKVILQAMGLHPNVSVAMGRLELRRMDCLVLCSDGLSNKMTDDELREVILTSPRHDVACNRLIEIANERGGEDNVTAIVAGVHGDLPAAASGETMAETFLVLQEFAPPPS
jgi:serine/threonine protein phosphatase PrpC